MSIIKLSIPGDLLVRYKKACNRLGFKDHTTPMYHYISEIIQKAEALPPLEPEEYLKIDTKK